MKKFNLNRDMICLFLILVLMFLNMPLASAITTTESTPDGLTQSQSLSLTEALDIADKNNPQLVVARKAVDIAQAGIAIANEIPNPIIFAQNSAGPFVALGVANGIGISQTVELAGKRKKRKQLAKSQYQLAIDQLNVARWDIREQTRQSYAAYASAVANKETLDLLVDYAKNFVNIAETRLKAGACPEADVVQARLTLSQMATQENQALSQIKQTQVALNNLLGISMLNDTTQGYTINDYGIFKLSAKKTELIPLPTQKPLDVDILYAKAIKARPDLIAAMQQVKVMQDQIKLIKAQRIPDPQISPIYGYLTPNSMDIPASQSGKSYLQGITLQVSMTAPIFHNQGPELKQANVALQQAQLQVDATIKQLKNDIRAAYLSYEIDIKNIEVYQNKLIPDAKTNLELAQLSYQYGKSPLANVILAQQNQQQIIQNYLQTVTSFQNDWAKLEQAVGEPLAPSL